MMSRYDIEVEGSHNYLADGIMVHNSPETTSGGKALKFYASVRLDVRRIETLKDGTDAVGNRTRVKVVKNKCAPPFRSAEFDILYGVGISREGSLIDLGVEQGIVRKAGAWYTYEGDQLGQGKENARTFLKDNPDMANEIEKKIKEKLGVGPRLDADPNAVADGAPAAGAANGRPAGVTAGAAGQAPASSGRAPSAASAGRAPSAASSGRASSAAARAGSRAPAEARAVPSRRWSPTSQRARRGAKPYLARRARLRSSPPGPRRGASQGRPARPYSPGPSGPRHGRKPAHPSQTSQTMGSAGPAAGSGPGGPGQRLGAQATRTLFPRPRLTRRPPPGRSACGCSPWRRGPAPRSRTHCSGGTSRARPPRPSWTGSLRRA